jgi:hypothetical protein
MAPSRRWSRARVVLHGGFLLVLTLSLAAVTAGAQSGIFGKWLTITEINTGGYVEKYRLILTLHPNWRFEQQVQSLVFQGRYSYKAGAFSSMGQNTYRFVLDHPQQGEMPAWSARITVLSSTIMQYEDLTLGGKAQFQRVP